MKTLLLFLSLLSFFSCQNEIQEADQTALEPTAYDQNTVENKLNAAGTDNTVAKTPNPYNTPAESAEDTDEDIGTPPVSDDCADAIMDIVSSAPRVKEIMEDLEKRGIKPGMMIGDTPETSQNGMYDVRIGVNGDLRFETEAIISFDVKSNKLYEADWLTGDAKEINYDQILVKALGKDCI